MILRIRTGATGPERDGDEDGDGPAGDGDEDGDGPAGDVFGRAGSTTRWTAAGSGAGPPDRAGAEDERTGISAGVFRAFDTGSTAAGDEEAVDGEGEGEGDVWSGIVPRSPAAVRSCRGPALPGCGRRRSPSSGASFWSLAVDGSEVSGAPIPPRARAGEPDTSRGDGWGAGEFDDRPSLEGD
ncbi:MULTISPECIES: hypothetical protein [unclassified Streptomyces]|uniref:hypothetical protein n=1 Tax=unclassified Streptomyces TaxID=2593676 RepID=UPI00225087E4|nr:MULTISPECIES: hypothetical protein [unclassified Streptomyces]MCX5104677.1 hypothetical protein [Streptomyces sp. NBC_00439]WSC26563.1 hypothetical protein OG902_07685 [Streptomyces sp. NBC_01768]